MLRLVQDGLLSAGKGQLLDELLLREAVSEQVCGKDAVLKCSTVLVPASCWGSRIVICLDLGHHAGRLVIPARVVHWPSLILGGRSGLLLLPIVWGHMCWWTQGLNGWFMPSAESLIIIDS